MSILMKCTNSINNLDFFIISDKERWDNRYDLQGPFLYSLTCWKILRNMNYKGYGGLGKYENGIDGTINIIRYKKRMGFGFKNII